MARGSNEVEHVPEQRLGDATITAMSVAGLGRRQASQRRWLAIAGVFAAGLALLVALDLMDLVHAPFLELGPLAPLEGPKKEGVALEDELTPAERERLRQKLLGGDEAPSAPVKSTMAAAERTALLDIYSSKDKKEQSVSLPDRSSLVVPNLPNGLTSEAIYEVIADNNGSVSLCFADSQRRGEKINGKLEIEMTIGPAGSVSDAAIATAKVKNTTFASCVLRRIRAWRFPTFSGDPVTVVYPYVVSGF